MSAPEAAVQECDLFFFVVGGQTFAVDPLDILRVDRSAAGLPTVEILPGSATRVLVARGAEGEFQLPVERVIGVRRFVQTALRRPPTLALQLGGPRAHEVLGVVLDEGTPVLVVDLRALSARAVPATA